MILGRDLLIALGMDIKFSEGIIIGGETPYEGCLAPMVDVSNYNFTSMKDKTVEPEESFINTYVNESFESDSAISSIRRMRRILDNKYEKSNLNKVMTKQCQHLNATELYRLINRLKKFEDMFDGTLGTWNTTPVDLELKDDTKPVCS